MRISFKCALLVLILCSSYKQVKSQKRLLETLDTLIVSPNSYLEKYSAEEFYTLGVLNDHIDPNNVDADLLAAAIFHEINRFREKRKRVAFNQHSVLSKMGYSYIDYHKSYKFREKTSNQYRLIRFYRKVPKYIQLDFTYVEGLLALKPIIDYTKGDVYFNDELETSPVNLYLGKFSKEEEFEEEPIQLISYSEFVKRYITELTRGKSGALLRSKAYELMSVEVRNEKKYKSKSHVPQVKIICLLGAYRNKYILEELEKEQKHLNVE